MQKVKVHHTDVKPLLKSMESTLHNNDKDWLKKSKFIEVFGFI